MRTFFEGDGCEERGQNRTSVKLLIHDLELRKAHGEHHISNLFGLRKMLIDIVIQAA